MELQQWSCNSLRRVSCNNGAALYDEARGAQARLARLEATHAGIASLVRHMVQLDPDLRHPVDTYLHEWPEAPFPESFRTLHALLAPLTAWSKDRGVLHFQACFAAALGGGGGGGGAAAAEGEASPAAAAAAGGGGGGSWWAACLLYTSPSPRD